MTTTIVITPPRRLRLPPLRQMWEAREVGLRFGMRDVTLRYRQTALGVIWVVLQPLLGAGIFTLVFGQLAEFPSDGVPYFVLSFAGMLAWSLFGSTLGRSSSSLVGNQALVSKVYFPRMLVPLSGTLSVALDFLVGLVMMAVLLVVGGVTPGPALLLLPMWVAAMLLIANGLGLALSALMVTYRDVAYVVPFLIQMLLYATPVAYTLTAVPANLRWLFELNPLTWILEGFRWSLLNLAAPPLWQIVAAPVVGVVAFVVGSLIFEHLERGFADVI